MIREMYLEVFHAFHEKNAVISIEHTLPCNVPGIRTAINSILVHSTGYVLHTEIKLLL